MSTNPVVAVSWCITSMTKDNRPMDPFVTTLSYIEENLRKKSDEACPGGHIMVEAMYVEVDHQQIEFCPIRLSLDRNATGWHSNKPQPVVPYDDSEWPRK